MTQTQVPGAIAANYVATQTDRQIKAFMAYLNHLEDEKVKTLEAVAKLRHFATPENEDGTHLQRAMRATSAAMADIGDIIAEDIQAAQAAE